MKESLHVTKIIVKILRKVIKIDYNGKGKGGHECELFSFDFLY